MYPVTQDFNDIMQADELRIYGRCVVDYTDPFIDQSISVSASEQSNASYPSQTADAVAEPAHKWASLDGSWVLDGSYALAPATEEEAKILQMGWWGSTLAGVGGAFSSPYPTLTVQHASRPIHSLRVVGDSKREEYPVDFEVRLYDSSDTLLHTESVTGNTDVAWSKTVAINQVAKSVLEITRWSHEGRQVKILEFFTSIQETYEGDDILLINLLEEREVSQGSLPVGNISANEIDIRLDNSSRKFDAGNTQSPLYQLLKPNRRIRAWLGIDAENAESENPPTFTRASSAINPETGAEVAVDEPRFVAGPFPGSRALLVEEGTENIIPLERQKFVGWTAHQGASVTLTQDQVVEEWGATDATRIQTTGGSGFLKYFYSVGPLTGTYSLQLRVKNQGTATVRIHSNQGGKTQDVAPGQSVHVKLENIVGDGVGHIQIQLRTLSVEDNLDLIAWRPMVEAKPYATSFIDGTRSNELATIPTAGVLSPQEGTIECWVYIDKELWSAFSAVEPRYSIWNTGLANNYGTYSLYYYPTPADQMGSNIRFRIVGDGLRTIYASVSSLNTGWHNFVCGWSQQRMYLAIDGTLIDEIVNPDLADNFYKDGIDIGHYNGSGQINTPIADLRISSRARTDAEILAGYESGEPLPKDEWTTYKLPFNGSIYPVERCWIPLGTFWSGDWTAPEDGLYAQTTGRDRLDMLTKSTYSTSQVVVGATLYDLSVAVLQDAGLEPEEYSVDEALKAYAVPYAWFEPQSHREALRKIAEASLSAIYCDRHGVIRVEPFTPAAGDALAITADDYFRKDNPAKYAEVANVVEVETQPLRPDALQEVYRSNEPVSIEAGQTLTLTAYYNEPPCIDAVASLEDAPAGCSITDTTYYAWGATVKVSSPNAGTFTLVVKAKPLKVLNKERATARDEASIVEHGTLRYRFPDNPLVQTREVAQTIADTLLASSRESRRDLEMEWRGNPALLLGDRVTVTDKHEQNDYYVTRQEIEYSGALRARLSGRKVAV